MRFIIAGIEIVDEVRATESLEDLLERVIFNIAQQEPDLFEKILRIIHQPGK